MRVAIHNGRIIEAQSGDGAKMDALRRNASAAGYKVEEVEFTVINDAEVKRRIAEQNAELPQPKSRMDVIEDRLAALEADKERR